jgi:hypothetical protein
MSAPLPSLDALLAAAPAPLRALALAAGAPGQRVYTKIDRGAQAAILFLGVVFLVALLAAVVATLRRERARDLGLLAAITLVGIGLRLWLARHLLMGVSEYRRDVPWFWWLLHNNFPVAALFPDGLSRLEMVAIVNRVLSAILPVLLYVQARLGFPLRRLPHLVALLFALTPIPIAFAASTVEFISSMVASSAMLIFLHRLIVTPERRRAAFYALAIAVSFVITTDVRPENVCFALVVPIAFYAHADAAARRRPLNWIALGAVAALAGYFALHLVRHGSTTPAPGTGVRALADLFHDVRRSLPRGLFDTNNYFKPGMLPPALTALAILGGLRLLAVDARRFLYLACWFGSIYTAHALITGENFLIRNRYALHTIVPVLFAAAYGLDLLIAAWARLPATAVWQRRGALGVALAAVLATTPGALRIVRFPDDDVEQEYHFLDELWRRHIPEPGAMVVESYGDGRTSRYSTDSRRYGVLGARTSGGDMVRLVRSEPTLRPHDGPIYLYEGLPCLWDREGALPQSPYCIEGRRSGDWELVASRAITGEVHDVAAGMPTAGGTIALYRLRTPPPSSPPPTPAGARP